MLLTTATKSEVPARTCSDWEDTRGDQRRPVFLYVIDEVPDFEATDQELDAPLDARTYSDGLFVT